MHCKGADTGLLSQWLGALLSPYHSRAHAPLLAARGLPRVVVDIVLAFVGPVEVDLIADFWEHANVMLNTLATAPGCWLTTAERLKAGEAGKAMLAEYEKLSALYADHSYFWIRPKAHCLAHITVDLLSLDPCPNFWCDTCWMDEDFIGKCCRHLIQKSDPRTLLTSCVEKYLALLKSELVGARRMARQG